MADLVLSFTIPDAKVADAKTKFLAAKPKPGSEPFASMTDNQWIKHYIKTKINAIIRAGDHVIQEQAITSDSEDYMPND